MSSSATALYPLVFWAQSQDFVYLKVDLKNIKSAVIRVEPFAVHFWEFNSRLDEKVQYKFDLDLLHEIDAGASSYKYTDRSVQFVLKKFPPSDWWDRITKDPKKPHWLMVDWEKWLSGPGDMDDDEEAEEMMDYGSNESYSNGRGKYTRDRETPLFTTKDIKKLYMFLYNFFQWIGYSYILAMMLFKYFIDGENFIPKAYATVGFTMKFCALLQFMEVAHTILGFTRGNPLATFLQIGGRAIVLFPLTDSEPRMHEKPVVFFVFLLWSTIEIIRYPYYMFQVYRINVYMLKWLRYTAWIILYPLGFFCEGVIVLRSIPYLEETLRFSVLLPNRWNFSFYPPHILRVYLLSLHIPFLCYMMSYMYRQRTKKIGPRSYQKKKETEFKKKVK